SSFWNRRAATGTAARSPLDDVAHGEGRGEAAVGRFVEAAANVTRNDRVGVLGLGDAVQIGQADAASELAALRAPQPATDRKGPNVACARDIPTSTHSLIPGEADLPGKLVAEGVHDAAGYGPSIAPVVLIRRHPER